MESETIAPVDPASSARYFIPTQSCGGLVAAVGLLFVAGIGLLTTLPGSPVAASYPGWLTWTLRLLPLPLIVLLWAVVSEAEFRIKTDASAIYFRRGLGAVTRVPWREVHDYFANCGRGLAEVASSGGSLVHDSETAMGAPFADYRPDYTLLSERGVFIFDDAIAHLDVLAAEVVAHVPPEAPPRWEEASWVTCEGCRTALALSLWRPAMPAEPLPPPTCLFCGRSLASLLAGVGGPFVIELRGPERRRFAWYPPSETPPETVAEASEVVVREAEPIALGEPEPAAEEPRPIALEEPPSEGSADETR